MATPDERKMELERKKQRLAEIREEKRRREDERRQKLLQHQQNKGGDTSTSSLPTDDEMEKILHDVGISAEASAVSSAKGAMTGVSGDGSLASAVSSPSRTVMRGRAGSATLQKSETTQVNIAPKDSVAYNKTTQTDTEGAHEFHSTTGDWWEDDEVLGGRGAPGGGLEDSPEEIPAKVENKDGRSTGQAPPQYSEEEKQQILTSPEFQVFFDRTSRILERALTEEVDIFVDYARDTEDTDKVDTGVKLSFNRCFFDEKWSKGRCVSSLDYSVQHPELIVASYQNNEATPHEPDGTVLVWNSKFKKTSPEYVFYCQSRVTSVAFAKFHPNLILGGTYSGQICLWDNRQNKKTPVQRSPLSTAAHTHPVYSMQVVGTQNAHNLISVSTDGRMCSWSLDMLAQPQETLDLQWKQSRQVASTSLSFPLHDVNNFVVGSEEGVVYSGCRHGGKAGIMEAFEGHFAPITGIDCHKAVGNIDFTHLFLTSSFDWTVKLWNVKEQRPLHSFEDHSDYVLDVAWSPIHPALFACVDGQGRVDLWNLNQDMELPAASVFVQGRTALNKILWTANGQQLVVGDNQGSIWIYDVSDNLANPKSDEWEQLGRTLLDLKQAQLEAEELSEAMGLGQTR